MNSPLLRWLLDVDLIPTGSEQLQFAWERPWPAWVWSVLLVVVALFALWSYTRLTGHRFWRGVMAGARAVLILLVLVLISGPMLQLPRETVEQDWVLVLADRSQSMTIADGATSTSPQVETSKGRMTREQQLRGAMDRQSEVLKFLATQRHVVWLGFHFGAFDLAGKGIEASGDQGIENSASTPPLDASMPRSLDASASLPDLGTPDGRRTDIESALDQALQRAAARPVSGIVLLSDGRTDAPPSRALLRRLQAEAIPVFVVPLGSNEPLGDLAIRRVEAPRRAFVRDKVPVVVELDQLGSAIKAAGGTVSLIDETTGEVLDTAEIPSVADRQSPTADRPSTLTLTAEPQLAGEATWKVVIDTTEPDLIPENNLKPFNIELIDRPLRVLFIEGYPRWEYRFVKELVRREKSIESSVMLISADRDFAQEGNVPITRLPRSPEEFAAYDVMILGDVPSGFFSPEQLDMIRGHVADRGAGLLWIAGERSSPQSYAGTALADLLPMRGSLELPSIGTPVTMQPTPLAERLGVMQLVGGSEGASESAATMGGSMAGWPNELADPSFGWNRLFWAQRIEPGALKPAAEVIAQTVQLFGQMPLPLVMSMRYGAGQSIYVATDETWRWRYGRGELYPEQFWLQMIRLLGRESLGSAGDQATLEASPRRVASGQPMRVELRVLDAQLLQTQRSSVAVVLETEDGVKIAEIELRKVDGTEDRYAATYLPDAPGSLRLRVDDPSFAALNLQAPVEVYSPDDELRRPETDHELLRNLATSTGGKVLTTDQLADLPQLLPNRSVTTMNPLSEPIWDSPLALILALMLLTFEWIGRKVLRLV
jgi:hypothetical protein